MHSHATEVGRRSVTAALFTALIFLVTINLRPAITGVGPVLTDIGDTFSLDAGWLGLLGALPLIMFAVVSLGASPLSSRLGVERALWLALILIATGIVIRSWLGAPGLWLGTVIVMGAIAIGNVLVPVVVRTDYRRHVTLATGVYSATMGLGAASASALSAPLADRFGWQHGLAFWAIPAVVVALLWIPRARHSTAAGPLTTSHTVPVWKSSSAWWLTVFMGAQSAAFYFMITWLPAYLVELGGTAEAAGLALFWCQLAGITAGFLTPLLMRGRHQVTATLGGTTLMLIGYSGLALAPSQFMVWATVLGMGCGIALVTSLSLISMRGRDARHTAALSGMVQSGGYLIAACAPFAAGLVAQVTGSLVNAIIMMVVWTALLCIVAIPTGRGEQVRA